MKRVNFPPLILTLKSFAKTEGERRREGIQVWIAGLFTRSIQITTSVFPI